MCKKCGKCCRQYPCIPLPDQLKEIAEYLKISIGELIENFMIIDYWADNPNKYYLLPKRKGDKDTYTSWSWAFSEVPCIFYKDNLCSIHEVKPHQGREYDCENKKQKIHTREWYADLWKSKLGVKYLNMKRSHNYDNI